MNKNSNYTNYKINSKKSNKNTKRVSKSLKFAINVSKI